MKTIRIGLIGDLNPAVKAHDFIPQALALAAKAESCRLEHYWLPTDRVPQSISQGLWDFDGLWCVPGSPYVDMDGAIRAIRFARERHRPFLGTCAGFQHALIEFARNVVGMADADHAETNPAAATPLISPLSCDLIEARGVIRLAQGSRLRTIYGRDEANEEYHCGFGLNHRYRERLSAAGLKIVGEALSGEARALELDGHPFYFATLFQPERSAMFGVPHPLVQAFLRSAM